MAQAQLQRCRPVVPSSTPPVQAYPFGAGSSPPQVVLSPTAPSTGRPTVGICFMVVADTATTIVIWKRDPASGVWGRLQSFDNVAPQAFGPFIWVTVCDLPASELWFETDAASDGHPGPLVLLEEMSG